MSVGTFIISLDCEGKWGMADKISSHHTELFTNKNIKTVYKQLIDLFESYETPATFAFVTALLMSYEEYSIFSDRFGGSKQTDAWLNNFYNDIKNSNIDGWFIPELLPLVQQAGMHEIASHGFVHLPLAEDNTSTLDANREIESIRIFENHKNIKSKTFIFPRNDIGHLRFLHEYGFNGFRDRLCLVKTKSQRVTNLLNELNIYQDSQPHAKVEELIKIPSGYFLNWRNGARKLVPKNITVLRWKNIIDRSIEQGGVAHLWFHPHNILDGDGQLQMLEEILKYVSTKRNAGQLVIKTQIDYCNILSNDYSI